MPTIDISNDYQYFDNIEAVTLTLERNAGDTTVAITKALRGAKSTAELSRMGARFATDSLTFFLPGNEVGSSNNVEPGDTITDGASTPVVYTILDVSRVEAGSILSGYKCSVTPERT